MTESIPITEFAPAERVSIDIVRRQAGDIERHAGIRHLLDSVLSYVLIVNRQRQIIFSSSNWADLVPGYSRERLLGQRPGEALNCGHAAQGPNGCGTSGFCRECGAAKAILDALGGNPAVKECRLLRWVDGRQQALDLLVSGTPIELDGETYALVSVQNIGAEKRRRSLERIFFHDLLNSTGSLEGLAGAIQERAPHELLEDTELLRAGLTELVELVEAQKDLAAAESHELSISPVPVQAGDLVEEVVELYRHHPVAVDRIVRCVSRPGPGALLTDPKLVRRVLGNLLKNALEATEAGGTVTVGYETVGNEIQFWVRNPTPMAAEVQLQVFKRSFSTKGGDRGLGTYSAKLLTEEYLNGRVSFASDPETGTIFRLTLPRLGPGTEE